MDPQTEKLYDTADGHMPSHRELPLAPGNRARIKVLDPMSSLGPSLEAELLEFSKTDVRVRVRRSIMPGSSVQVLIPDRSVVFGKVWLTLPDRDAFELEIAVQDVI